MSSEIETDSISFADCRTIREARERIVKLLRDAGIERVEVRRGEAEPRHVATDDAGHDRRVRGGQFVERQRLRVNATREQDGGQGEHRTKQLLHNHPSGLVTTTVITRYG